MGKKKQTTEGLRVETNKGGEEGNAGGEPADIDREHFLAYQMVIRHIVDYLCRGGKGETGAAEEELKPLDLLRLSNTLSIAQKGQRLAKQMDQGGTEHPWADWLAEIRERALGDASYHRQMLYNQPLYHPQAEAIRLIEQHIAERTGKVLTIRSARQTMKNECSAMLCVRALEKHREEGGVYIRTAPTWKPQITNSKLRVERFLKADPLIGKDYKKREGFMIQHGAAQLLFLSSDRKANVVGATASICLDVDEAHKVDRGKFEEDFAPMTAYHNVPTVMWGVAADKQDLLYEYVQYNRENEPDLVREYPAAVWCELIPQYAKHYAERRAKLGPEHPVILTQYDLVDLEGIGGYLKEHQIISLLDSEHGRSVAPVSGRTYIVTIDIAGEAEAEEEDPGIKSRGARDSTVALIWELDQGDQIHGYPACRLVDVHWWTGKSLGPGVSGLPGQQDILLRLLQLWKPVKTIVDARGVGEQIAKYLEKRNGSVEAYTASAASVSEDVYGLLALINNGRVKIFRNDSSPEYAELCRQLRHTKQEIKAHEQARIAKPAAERHIDMVKAMTYLYRALVQTVPAAMSGSEPEPSWYKSERGKLWG